MLSNAQNGQANPRTVLSLWHWIVAYHSLYFVNLATFWAGLFHSQSQQLGPVGTMAVDDARLQKVCLVGLLFLSSVWVASLTHSIFFSFKKRIFPYRPCFCFLSFGVHAAIDVQLKGS